MSVRRMTSVREYGMHHGYSPGVISVAINTAWYTTARCTGSLYSAGSTVHVIRCPYIQRAIFGVFVQPGGRLQGNGVM